MSMLFMFCETAYIFLKISMLKLKGEINSQNLLQAEGIRSDKATRRLEIPVSVSICGGMTEAELYEAQEKETQLAQLDRAMEQTKDRKNALESYVYDMRNKV